MNVSSTFVKKKISKSKPNKDNFLAEKTTVVEDILLYESTKVASKVSSKYVYYNTGYQGQVPGLRIVTGSENHPEKNRNPETILKDVVALTRNGNYTYIVDGVRVSEETFRSLNQNDVESVDIYKHTDAYNARFGNKENQSRIVLKSK